MKKIIILTLVFLALSFSWAGAQIVTDPGIITDPSGNRLKTYTVATLPAPQTGLIVYVSDGANTSDCTTGTGSIKVVCIYNGSAWAAISKGISIDTDCNQAQYFAIGVLCQDSDDGKLYKGTGTAIAELASSESAALTGDVTVSATLAANTAPALSGNSGVNWTYDGNWALSGGIATHTATSAGTLAPTSSLAPTAGVNYKIRFIMTRSAGSLTMTFGGVLGTIRSTAGTFVSYVTAATTGNLIFTPSSDFAGTITSVTVQIVTAGSLTVEGAGTYASRMELESGSAYAPAIVWDDANKLGIFRYGSTAIGFSDSSNVRHIFDNSFHWIVSNTGYLEAGATADTFLSRKAAANWQLGAADAAAPVAQTLTVQSVVAGTTDTAGTNLTIVGSRGTGTGAGGSIIFQTSTAAGGTGNTQNAPATALTINSAGVVTAAIGFSGALTGNASTASALAADPADCDAGTVATGINAAGTAACTAEPSLTSLTLTGTNPLILGTQSSAPGGFILHNATNNFHFTFTSGVSGSDIGWTTPIAAPAGNDYLVKASTTGVLGYTNPATFSVAAGSSSIVTVGALSSGSLASGFTPVTVPLGGTGASTYALNGVLYGNAANAIGVTAIGAEGQMLRVGASPFVPVWSTATYANTYAIGTLLHASAANVVAGLGAGITGQILTGVTGAAPAWSATPTVTSISTGTTGISLSGSNGTLTIAGTGDGQDENLTFDFNTTADKVTVASGTGVTKISLSALNLATTGIISGAIGVTPSAGSYTLGTIPEEVNGYLILLTAAGTLTLPDMTIGQSFCVMSRDDNEVITIDAHANDSITLCPTAATCAKGVAGATVVNTVSASDGAGNYICFLVVEADNIMQIGARGTWVVP